MTEPTAKYAPIPGASDMHKALPCPICGGENIASNEWTVDDDNAKKFDADEFSEIWAFECMDCLCAAPIKTWNTRPDPWKRPPEMPGDGQRVIMTYMNEDGEESMPITHIFHTSPKFEIRNIVRWMVIPEAL